MQTEVEDECVKLGKHLINNRLFQSGHQVYQHKWTVLYSISQGCFHIETLSDYLKCNRLRATHPERDHADFMMIGGLFDTHEEANEYGAFLWDEMLELDKASRGE